MILVYSYYVLDVVHKGHLEMLQNAKAIAGDDGRLIVGILTDEATMEKKPQPILCFEERIELARSIRWVDLVVVQRTYSPFENIKYIRPDILMESDSHEQNLDVVHLMDELGGRIITIPYFPNHSSSQVKEEIKRKQS